MPGTTIYSTMSIPLLSDVGSKHGAPMGRTNTIATPDEAMTFHIYPLEWIDGDYDSGGAYWGGGDDTKHVWRAIATSAEGEANEMFARASTREEMQAHVKAKFPQASFHSLTETTADLLKADDALSRFRDAYIDCALWLSTTPEGTALDRDYSARDFSEAALAEVTADCARFLEECKTLITTEGRERALESAARDFWLTRNGHGSGFWDGDWPANGEALAEACKSFDPCDLYLGDDKRIHIL